MCDDLTCFKTYDVRGDLNKNFDSSICYRIARAFASVLRPASVVVGRDARKSSPKLMQSICNGLIDEGVQVLDIGLAGTEEMYWATTQFEASGGIEITASHNPINYNGLKLVKSGSSPIEQQELLEIKRVAERNLFSPSKLLGNRIDLSEEARTKYVTKILSFVDIEALRPLKIVVNSGNGAAGPTFDQIAAEITRINPVIKFERMHHNVDSSFPNGIPNPILLQNHLQNKKQIIATKSDFGIAFDGDFDRCFFFDNKGEFVKGEYIVGLLAKIFLLKEPKATIVHDSRMVWNVKNIVEYYGGKSVASLTGHAFVKQAMRNNKAIYGGEISAHHYFQEFSYCDSGMIPWLLVLEMMSNKKASLSDLIAKQKSQFPSSGEINFNIQDVDSALEKVADFYEDECAHLDNFDGISMSFETWRFNLRCSNTESVVRLNVESRGDVDLVNRKVEEIKSILYS